MAMMWAGRFSKDVDSRVNDFNSSISFDSRMYRQDIAGSVAHAAMLGEQGIIEKGESEKIIQGLKGILADLDSGALEFDPNAEDIHMFIEQVLTERIGDAGKRLHTSRSRNDQVALDLRLYLRDKCGELSKMIFELIEAIITAAQEHYDTVMPGYTHLQRAQPVTFAHHIMAYAWMLTRDLDRIADCKKRMNYSPLGSCALAGTTYPINRKRTAELLHMSGVTANSMDGVSDRDYCIELASALSILMMHLSRFSEEIVMWCSWEFKFIELDDAYSTGSSIMPQKKNPDVTELIRGKTGRVYGDLMTLLSMMKNLPLAYNKDMQEDKEAIFDAIDTAELCITTFIPMFRTMTVIPENMRAAAARGFINATDCADYLVKKGLPFRDAYKITGTLVARCIELGTTLEELDIKEYRRLSDKFEEDVYKAISLDTCVNQRCSEGGPAPEAAAVQVEQLKAILRQYDFD